MCYDGRIVGSTSLVVVVGGGGGPVAAASDAATDDVVDDDAATAAAATLAAADVDDDAPVTCVICAVTGASCSLPVPSNFLSSEYCVTNLHLLNVKKQTNQKKQKTKKTSKNSFFLHILFLQDKFILRIIISIIGLDFIFDFIIIVCKKVTRLLF